MKNRYLKAVNVNWVYEIDSGLNSKNGFAAFDGLDEDGAQDANLL